MKYIYICNTCTSFQVSSVYIFFGPSTLPNVSLVNIHLWDLSFSQKTTNMHLLEHVFWGLHIAKCKIVAFTKSHSWTGCIAHRIHVTSILTYEFTIQINHYIGKYTTLRITGPYYRGGLDVFFVGVMGSPNNQWLEIPWFLGQSHESGQIIIFHQPRFPWNSRGFPLLFTTILGWKLVFSVAN